VEQSIFFRNS